MINACINPAYVKILADNYTHVDLCPYREVVSAHNIPANGDSRYDRSKVMKDIVAW